MRGGLEEIRILPIRKGMGSVAGVNPGLADVLQSLTGTAGGALSSALASGSVQSALQSSSPSDIVQLSLQAQQLVVANGLFGAPAAPVTTDPATLLLQAVNSSISVSG
jgi:hypothetical protein